MQPNKEQYAYCISSTLRGKREKKYNGALVKKIQRELKNTKNASGKAVSIDTIGSTSSASWSGKNRFVG